MICNNSTMYYMKYLWKISSSSFKQSLINGSFNSNLFSGYQIERYMAHVSNKRITRLSSEHEVDPSELKEDGNEKYIDVRLRNRNPRNLEQMLMEPKQTGYEMDQRNPHYWNRVVLEKKSKHLVGKIVHHSGRIIIEASTNEPSIMIFLKSSNQADTKAALLLGQVLATRALEAGIHSVFYDRRHMSNQQQQTKKQDIKLSSFIESLERNGLTLNEQANIVNRAQRDH